MRVLFHHQLNKRRKRHPRPVSPHPEWPVKQILRWADDFHHATGRWPKVKSGRIAGGLGATWLAVDSALRAGLHGLPGGSSLARLLAQHRGVRNIKDLPHLTTKQVMAWADAHCRRTGKWPLRTSGAIHDAPGETWLALDACLRHGSRGLPGGFSLTQLLANQRGIPNRLDQPRLTVLSAKSR